MMFKLIFVSALLISCTLARPADDDKIDDLDDWDLEDAAEGEKASGAETVTVAAEPEGPVSHIQKIPPRNAKPVAVNEPIAPVPVSDIAVARERRDTELRHTKRDTKAKRNKKNQGEFIDPPPGDSGEPTSSPQKPASKPKRSRKGGKGKKKPLAADDVAKMDEQGGEGGEQMGGEEEPAAPKPRSKPKKQRKPKKPRQPKHRRGGKQRQRKTTTPATEPSLSEAIE